MTHSVRYAPEAIRDLSGIYRYIVRESGEPAVALRFVTRIRVACDRLTDFPERGTRRDEIKPGIRTMGFEKRATSAFVVRETEVRIVRIAYAGRDLTRMRLRI